MAGRATCFRELFRANVFPVVAGLRSEFGSVRFSAAPLPAKITVQIMPPVDLVPWAERLLVAPWKDSDADEQDVVWTCFYELRDSMRARLDRLYAERRFPILG